LLVKKIEEPPAPNGVEEKPVNPNAPKDWDKIWGGR